MGLGFRVPQGFLQGFGFEGLVFKVFLKGVTSLSEGFSVEGLGFNQGLGFTDLKALGYSVLGVSDGSIAFSG